MSERVWLGEGRRDWAEVNLSDHVSIMDALEAVNFTQCISVFGPKDELDAFRHEWERLYEGDSDAVKGQPPRCASWVEGDPG